MEGSDESSHLQPCTLPVDLSSSTSTDISEGKCTIQLDPKYNTFYNPAQEVNRDISVLAIQTFINITPKGKRGRPESVSILEAMAASGIRSIRYAKEITGIFKIIANDMSQGSFDLICQNSTANGTSSIVQPKLSEASSLMYSQPNEHFIVDIDPYGTPVPFLDSAIKCVKDGGIILVTATDLAILAGNAAETCYAKYGSMSLKSSACHELALRIVIHAVQTTANKYGRYVEPLLSLKIDFYVRLLFRVKRGPEVCKKSVSKTSLVYQCVGCHSLSFQQLGIIKKDGKHGFAAGPTVSAHCEHCNSIHYVGGPIWSAPIHDKAFVKSMLETLIETHSYLGTSGRIEGLLNLVLEEIENPLYYDTNQLCSVVKTIAIPMLKIRSALMNLGFEVSLSHTGPNTLKTNAPNAILWDILREWAKMNNANSKSNLAPKSPGFYLVEKPTLTQNISFDVRTDANPISRESGILRFQMNPTKFWGPGVRSTFKADAVVEKRRINQGKRKRVE